MCLAESRVEPGCTLVPGGAEVDQFFTQVSTKTWPCSRASVHAQEAMHVVVSLAKLEELESLCSIYWSRPSNLSSCLRESKRWARYS